MGEIVASVYPCACVCVCVRDCMQVQCVLAVVDPGRCAVALGPSHREKGNVCLVKSLMDPSPPW